MSFVLNWHKMTDFSGKKDNWVNGMKYMFPYVVVG